MCYKMTFCNSCGKEVPPGATFCPACGATVVQPGSQPGNTEFDRLTRDSRTQEHWLKRIFAYIIDWIVVIIATFVLSIPVYIAMGISVLALGTSFFNPFARVGLGAAALSALLFVLYFTLMEGVYQKTIGKSLLGLHVETLDGKRVTIEKAFIRNISKIYWLLLLLDLIGGFFMKVKPGQRYMDTVANTIVVS